MVDTPKEGNGDKTVEDDPSKKQTKRRRRRRPKSCLSKNSDNSARENNTPVDSRGDDNIDPAIEQDELANGKHSTEQLCEHVDAEDKAHQPPSGEENSLDEDAHIIPERHLEQENLRRRLIATARSLKKQKQRLKAAQNTLNSRWNKVLDNE